MTNDRERFLRFMRAMNTIDGEYAALMHGLRVKESLFVLLYACLDEAPRSQKEICDEWRMPRSTLNTAVLEEIKAGNVALVPCGPLQEHTSWYREVTRCIYNTPQV